MFRLLLLASLLLTGCTVKMHGRLTCDGPCELVLDREVSEMEILPKTKEK